jgi:hypothetical protein
MRHMWYWQGLRWAPGGLLLLVTATVAIVSMPWPVRWLTWLAAVIVSARLHSVAGRYYARHFPYIRPGRLTNSGLLASGLLIAALIADVVWTPPVLITAVTGAAVLLGYGLATGGGRPHHVGGMILLMAIAPLPAIDLVDGARPRVLLWLFACGVLYTVLAVLDHRELMVKHRLLQRTQPSAPAGRSRRSSMV